MAKGEGGWRPGMEQRAGSEDGWQVKCLTADAGHMWMPSFDRLPAPVRRRLAASRHNICAACLEIEASRKARERRRRGSATIGLYLALIAAIERSLDSDRQPALGPLGNSLDDFK